MRSTAEVLNQKINLYSTNPGEDYEFGIDEIANIYHDKTESVSKYTLNYLRAAIQIKVTGKSTLFTQLKHPDIFKNVKYGDVCLSIGGDNYCYAGTEILADYNTLLKKRGAKTVLWGCSINPEALNKQVIKDLKSYNLITVRESLTQEVLRNVGIHKNVRSVSDTAFLIQPETCDLPKGFIRGKTIGLNLSPLFLKHSNTPEILFESFIGLIDYILENTDYSIVLIPHVLKASDNDLSVLDLISSHYQDHGRVIFVNENTYSKLKYVISNCKIFIGARTHATIAAYSSKVPTLALGYSIKSKGIARDLFGTDKHFVLSANDIHSSRDLVREFNWIIDNEVQIRRTLENILPRYIEKARESVKYIQEL